MIFPENRKIALLGLGIVGSRAAARLIEAGWQVSAWNRTAKGNPYEVDSAENAVRGAGIVSIYLKDAPTVRSIIERISAELSEGQIVLNHATIDLETTHWLHAFCEARGCRFLDTPFTGSKVAAEKGELVYYTGGDMSLAQEVKPFLDVTSRAQLHCGEVGAATIVKLATNLISASTVQALAESLAVATSHGVSTECFVEAVSLHACASTLTGMKLGAMASGEFDAHFSLSNMGKDSRYVLALGEAASLKMPGITAVSERMGELEAAGLGDLDYAAVMKPYLQQ